MTVTKTLCSVLLVAALLIVMVPAPVSAAGESVTFNGVNSFGCDLGQSRFSITFNNIDTTANYYLDWVVTGSDGLIYTDHYRMYSGATVVTFTVVSNGSENDRGLVNGTYPMPAGITNYRQILLDANEQPLWLLDITMECDTGTLIDVTSESLETPPAEEEVVAEPVPGCDMLIAIPDTAVGATITADTPVYWMPGEASSETFPAGLTLRAIGVDASGAYTKVLYACGYYWVPTGVIGPNYDEVWNGAPLPTEVVD